MGFYGYIPPEFVVMALIIIGLLGLVGYFVTTDWIIPFVAQHVSIH